MSSANSFEQKFSSHKKGPIKAKPTFTKRRSPWISKQFQTSSLNSQDFHKTPRPRCWNSTKAKIQMLEFMSGTTLQMAYIQMGTIWAWKKTNRKWEIFLEKETHTGEPEIPRT